jgi:hypothetical protein
VLRTDLDRLKNSIPAEWSFAFQAKCSKLSKTLTPAGEYSSFDNGQLQLRRRFALKDLSPAPSREACHNKTQRKVMTPPDINDRSDPESNRAAGSCVQHGSGDDLLCACENVEATQPG